MNLKRLTRYVLCLLPLDASAQKWLPATPDETREIRLLDCRYQAERLIHLQNIDASSDSWSVTPSSLSPTR